MSAISTPGRRSVEMVTRFSRGQRIEHYVLIVTFTALALTGLPQMFSTQGWAAWMINDLFGGINLVRTTHHFFAWMLVLEAVYHVGALAISIGSGQMRHIPMLPNVRDIYDIFAMFKYFLGRGAHPRFDRYSYKEKAEYWAIIWGTILMALTGFVLMFPEAAARIIPGSLIPAAKAAHGAEAILAVLAIVTWHFYNAHFNPKIFPFDTSMFSGKISKERMREEHPLEYDRLFGEAPEAAALTAPVAVQPPQPVDEEPHHLAHP